MPPDVPGRAAIRKRIQYQARLKLASHGSEHGSSRAILGRLKDEELEKVQKRHEERLSHASLPLLQPLNVVVKDNFVTTALPTTCASNILNGFTGTSDATVVNLLRQNGIGVIAKTNMDEFGMGSHSTNSAFGSVQNLQDKRAINRRSTALSAGGSSGGSAVAVADDIVDAAIGSDTGGSVRLPAAYTGVIGFKPSYGMISRNGLIPYANSLDTVGILGRRIKNVESLFNILNVPDHRDPTCLTSASRQRVLVTRILRSRASRGLHGLVADPRMHDPCGPSGNQDHFDPTEADATSRPGTFFMNDSALPLEPIRVGVPKEYNIAELHPSVRAAWTRVLTHLKNKGDTIVPISLPTTTLALSAYYVLAPAEASSNLAKYDGIRYGAPRTRPDSSIASPQLFAEYRGGLFGKEVQRRILLGTFTLSASAMDNYFIQAQRVRRLIQQDFNRVFRREHPLLDEPDGSDEPDSSDEPSAGSFTPLDEQRAREKEGVDFIIVPTAPTPAPRLADVEAMRDDPLVSYVNDIFTVPSSLAGLPAISMPIGLGDEAAVGSDGRGKIGVQIIGQYGDDKGVLNYARHQLEELNDS